MGAQSKLVQLMASLAVMSLIGCSNEAGSEVDEGGFGNPTMNNTQAMTGQINATVALGHRFASEVPTTINFDFNSSEITPAAMAVLIKQADWIRQFPEVRFRVYGHTDLVGSDAYNKALGLRRAKAVVAFFASQGISRSRLEAVASFGETQPVILTQSPEERNRRTVTEVTGFVQSYQGQLNGKYAEVLFREYIAAATRPHPGNTPIVTEVNPAK